MIKKSFFNVLIAAFVLSMVPTVQAAAQQGHIESPAQRQARLKRETAAKKKKQQVVRKKNWKYQGDFYEGLARVLDDNGKYGFIDKTGQLVIPCKWESAWPFSEGLAVVQDNNGKWHKIDKTGKIIKDL